MGFPDVCKTPTPAGPVPIPYPNIAQGTDGEGSKKVKIDNKETLRKGDNIRMSSGDEAGSAQGVASSKIKGKTELMMGWPTVKAEGKEVGHLTIPTMQNGGGAGNAPGLHAAPGQTKVKVLVIKGVKTRVVVKITKYHPGSTDVPKTDDMDDNAKKASKSKNAQTKRQASEALGDKGAKNAAKELAKSEGGLGTAPPGLKNPHSFSGSGTVDVIAFCKNGVVLVMEAKGGGSSLGTAAFGGKRYKQGTPGYLKGIADKMSKSKDPKRAAAGRKLKAAIKKKKAKYCEARTRYNAKGAKNTKVKEFDP
jgi:hypothetical protein